MFGLFRTSESASGPVAFSHAVTIAKPCEDVFPLLDWSDPRNARAAGHAIVEPLRGAKAGRGCYRLHLPEMPEHHFLFTELEKRAPTHYAYQCDVLPQVGHLLRMRESWTLHDAGEGHCLLSLKVDAIFDEGMREVEFSRSVSRLSLECEERLDRLKRHAEEGVEIAAMDAIVHVSHIGLSH